MRRFLITGIAILCLSFFSNLELFAQQFLTKVDGWNAYVHLPDEYDQNPSKTYPVIIFIPGIGEIGTNASDLLKYGPNNFVNSGNSMSFNVNGQTVKPIVISIQPVTAWPSPDVLDKKIDAIVSNWRVDVNRIHLTGLSMGGWSWENYVDGYNSKYTNRIASVVAMSAPSPDNTISNMKLFAQAGGKWWGFEGTGDYRLMDQIRDTMNKHVPGSARYYQYIGGHCCWNTWYNPSWTDTDGESIYTWMLRQSLGTKVNQSPIVSAGSDINITLPTNSTVLTGTASDPDGSIAKYEWSQISGPGSATIVTPGTFSSAVKDLIAGDYKFSLKVTDNEGATASSSVTVSVKSVDLPPSANAGSDQEIQLPASTAILTGTGTDPISQLLGFEWSQQSGPSTAEFSNESSAITNVSKLKEGVYVFNLEVTNELNLFSIASVKVTVNAASVPPDDCGCDVTLPRMPDGGIYFTNGKSITIKPGQKVCIKSGYYPYINLSGIVGTETQPITIINCGGQVLVGSGPTYCYNITKSRYFRFTGTGTPGIKYGFKAYWPGGTTASSMSVRDSTSNYEIDHFEAQNATNGFLCKIDPFNCDPGSWSTGWTIRNISIHDTYVHGTEGEGYYIANTSKTVDVTDCSGKKLTIEPVMIDGIKMYNNICDSTGWDGIQVTSAKNAEIYNNRVTNYGLTNMGSQQAGIILGSKSYGKVYNNYVANGTGEGIVLTGYQNNMVYNNVIVNAGWDGSNVRQDALSIDDRPMPSNEYVGLQIYIFNNTIVNPGRSAIHLFNSYKTMGAGNKVYNNLLVKPNNSSPYGNKYLAVDGNADVDSSNNLYLLTIDEAHFVNALGYDFHLNANSLAIDAGLNISQYGVISDMDNLSRPQGNAYDVGAFEYDLGTLPQNQAPVANAGGDQYIKLPVNSVTLSGSGSDVDGTVVSYQWKKISGPANFTIKSPSSSKTDVIGLSSGVYVFELTVTDNGGAVGMDSVKITVSNANVPPVANAGSDQTITLPNNSVSLNGIGTDADGSIASYLWTKISGPSQGTITNSTVANTTANNLAEGTYLFELKVTDNDGAGSKDTISVKVNSVPNISPTANAGADKSITLPVNNTSLSGSGTDADGTIASYSWTKVSGPASFNISNASSPATDVTGLAEGVYEFQLKVTDNKGATATDVMKVTVNPAANKPPTANAGADNSITLPVNNTSLSGSGTDADGTIASYSWTKVSGPASFNIVNASSPATDVTGLVEGVYEFQLKVTDNKGATDTAVMKVTVNPAANKPPTANAGGDKSITLPVNSTSLSGSGTDADGTIASYSWTKVSGPASFNIVNASSPATDVTGLVEGVYEFQLKVTDNKGATATDVMKVTVNPAANKPPTANAGADKSITLPVNNTSLSGSGTDADGTIASYSWTKVSGPASFNVVNASSPVTDVTGLVEGVYEFQLKVTDNKGATATDVMKVTVNPAANKPPTANAGADKSITLPVNNTSLSGSGTDADGTIVSYLWTKVSGPASFNVVNASSPVTDVTGLVEGVYEFQLKVTDNKGATATDVMKVTVNPAANKPPTANAGADKSITLPVNSTSLSGSGTDADGTIASYLWTKVSGPASFNIVNATSPVTNLKRLVEGVYEFQLKVTDNKGATATDVMKVTVNGTYNKPPTANAGSDRTIMLPINSITIKGSGKDRDGTIEKYYWAQVSGPSNTLIAAPESAMTQISGLIEGSYLLELTVIDNGGQMARDTMKITVEASKMLTLIEDIKVYPNPTTDIAILEINGTKENDRMLMVITDGFGNLVTKKEINVSNGLMTEKIDLTKYPKGLYNITLYKNGQVQSNKKVMKIK